MNIAAMRLSDRKLATLAGWTASRHHRQPHDWDEENVDSWGIIELQGDLESRSGGSLLNQFVGDLHFSMQSNGVPILIIGHHILYGKCVNMEKPYAVLQKRILLENTEYLVKAIVRKKLVFKIRPKPIIASVPGAK